MDFADPLPTAFILLDFKFTVQAALEIYNLSALGFIILAARKWISQVNVVYHCGKDDQMALPSGHPQAFREKGLTQTLYLALICAAFLICPTPKKIAL